MRKIVAPEEYEIYHDNQEKFYALDKENMDLIESEFFEHKSYFNIPEEKEVECFEMDIDEKTIRINFDKKVRIPMNQLSDLTYEVKYVESPKEKTGKKESC